MSCSYWINAENVVQHRCHMLRRLFPLRNVSLSRINLLVLVTNTPRGVYAFFRKHLSTKCDNGRLRFAIPGYDNDEVERRRETVRLGSSIARQVNKPSCR